MTLSDSGRLCRETLLGYFLAAATPPGEWRVGMELEKMGRKRSDGRPLAYDTGSPSVRDVLRFYQRQRDADPIYEADNVIGLAGDWGTISLEPGGQVEWSSRPHKTLGDLERALDEHLRVMRESADTLGIDWLEVAVDPVLPLKDMPWMPKARYNIMRPFLGARGALAHRMMTQTASIQCAFDFAGPRDWARKFRAAALLAPVATALFANSSEIDGAYSGYRSYRQAIWRETDPDRCGLPPVVFDEGFGLEAWLDYVLTVPTIFRHRSRGRVSSGGVPFGRLLDKEDCAVLKERDWETHISTIFTDVRSYTYIEVRSADLLPDRLALSVPAFWTGILYHDQALDRALGLGSVIDSFDCWSSAMESASREGIAGRAGGREIAELAADALAVSIEGLANGAHCSAGAEDALPLRRLCEHHGIAVRV